MRAPPPPLRILAAAAAVAAAVALALGAPLAGCAAAAPYVDPVRGAAGGPHAAGGDPGIARLPPPVTSGEAQAYLSGSLAALRAGKPKHAALFLDAILRSDHLTDRGRANVYWLDADAHRLAGREAEYLDALAGFLVATEIIDDRAGAGAADEEMARRAVEARATLTAKKMQTHPLLGRTVQDAIPVEDARDPSGLVAELGCVEDRVATIPAGANRRVEERRLICEDNGESLVLFFDVTHTR